MTAQASLAVATTDLPAWALIPDSAVSDGPSSPQLRARISRPHQHALVIAVDGDVDAATVEHLQEVLWPRLSAAACTLVVELTGVGFLGVAGLQLLHQAHLSAQEHGLGLVLGGGEAERAVHMAGLDQDLQCFPTADQALLTLAGRA